MELNTRGRYAVMAIADVARHGAEAPVPLSAVADRQQLSVAYLEQIFLKLRRAGLVESERGRSGGYRLGRPAHAITIAGIMDAVEEDTRMTRCMGNDEAGCLGHGKCLTHNLWDALGGHIRRFLASVSLQNVLDGATAEQLAKGSWLSEPAAPRAGT
jgi:Rrf2 family transcriptional regulator, iron-sulfur cluster assembly transcription factor